MDRAYKPAENKYVENTNTENDPITLHVPIAQQIQHELQFKYYSKSSIRMQNTNLLASFIINLTGDNAATLKENIWIKVLRYVDGLAVLDVTQTPQKWKMIDSPPTIECQNHKYVFTSNKTPLAKNCFFITDMLVAKLAAGNHMNTFIFYKYGNDIGIVSNV
jgi:hypothetical protein